MVKYDEVVYQEYNRYKTKKDFIVLGMIEIGSYAKGEAISVSDRDIRIIIRSDEPYYVLREHFWTENIDADLSYIEWEEINSTCEVTFGITNLSFVERSIDAGKFPLNDHTSMYQGCILVDEDSSIERFRRKYEGVSFANIVDDYIKQTEWRVGQKIQKESKALFDRKHLDPKKMAVPMVHTCYRVVRDIANIGLYQRDLSYMMDISEIDEYYRVRWPWFYVTFQQLYSFKTDENQRRKIFLSVQDGDETSIQALHQIQEKTILLWKKFKSASVKYRA